MVAFLLVSCGGTDEAKRGVAEFRTRVAQKSYSEIYRAAAAELIQKKWKPEPAPQWVTAVPSQRHTGLVQDFARRLAAKLDLPFVPALRKCRQTDPQKTMQNSPAQLRNLLRAFEIVEAPFSGPASVKGRQPASAEVRQPASAEVRQSAGKKLLQRLSRQLTGIPNPGVKLPPVPVLLVDDVVDSRWTLTLAAVLLQQHGSGPVYPFALAKASLRGS